MPLEVTSGLELFQSSSFKELLSISGGDIRPALDFKLQRENFLQRFSSFQQLNIQLFNVKVQADLLSGKGNTPTTGITNNSFAIKGGTTFFQNQPTVQLISSSAEALTDNGQASANTPFTVQGRLVINGETIFDFEDPQSISLQQIEVIVNQRESGVTAKIVKDRLVLATRNGEPIPFIDTTGKFGLHAPAPFSDQNLLPLLTSLGAALPKTNASSLQTLSAAEITGESSADATTPLYGVTGTLTIQGEIIGIGENGVADSLNSLKARIDARQIDGIQTEVRNNRLIVSVSYGDIKLSDNTKGGDLQQGLGVGRLAESKFSSPLSGAFFSQTESNLLSALVRERRLSFSATEITGNPSADADTALGLSGDFALNSHRFYLYPSQSLNDIKTLVNALVEGVEAKINGDRLDLRTLESFAIDLQIEDNTTGGAKNGLGLSQNLFMTESLPITLLAGESNATEYSFLPLQGELRINGETFVIGALNSTDTLNQLANTINVRLAGSVQASVTDGKLQLASLDGNPFTLVDDTQGGYGGTSQGFGLSVPAQIAQPMGTLLEAEKGNLFFPEQSRFILSGGEFAARNATANLTLQVTNLDTKGFVQENVENFFTDIKGALQEIAKETKATNGGDFKENKALIDLGNNLEKTLTDNEAKLKEIGVRLQKDNLGKVTDIQIEEKKLTTTLARTPSQIFQLLGDEKGIATKVSTLLDGILFKDGIPGVDFSPQKPLSFLSPKSNFSVSLLDTFS